MNLDSMRQQMLNQQIRTWDVLDERVLGVLSETPREAFVPESETELAFADTEIPLPHGQCMMAPKVEARLLQELAIEPDDRALEIGTGSGYLTACLARLAGTVTSLEIFPDMTDAAADKLTELGIANATLTAEDALAARIDDRFDVVAVTASVPTLPDRFIEWLNPGGRLFVIVGRTPVMEARLITQHGDGGWTHTSLFETVITPMINADQSEPFLL
jgi:protein-L-isoaspartate(D-aspartate) O-methyltransferase